MNQAYKDLIMNANIDSNKKKLGGKYYLAGQGQYRQETFGRMLGIDVSQAHDASADIKALKQINNRKEFQQLINHANEIIGGSRLGYENISEGTKLFNTSSLWGNQNIFKKMVINIIFLKFLLVSMKKVNIIVPIVVLLLLLVVLMK